MMVLICAIVVSWRRWCASSATLEVAIPRSASRHAQLVPSIVRSSSSSSSRVMYSLRSAPAVSAVLRSSQSVARPLPVRCPPATRVHAHSLSPSSGYLYVPALAWSRLCATLPVYGVQ